MDAVKTGKFIRMLRTEKGITQKDLAETLHVSNAAISKWETGHGLPDISLLGPLASALDIAVADLINGEKSQEIISPTSDAAIKEIIRLSEKERKKRNTKQTLILILIILLISVSGYFFLHYLWSHQTLDKDTMTVLHWLDQSVILGLAAILSGLASWVLAFIGILRGKKMKQNRWTYYSILSFAFCAFALWIPILCIDLNSRIGDTSAILDTAWGYNFVSIVLILITTILNIISCFINKNS